MNSSSSEAGLKSSMAAIPVSFVFSNFIVKEMNWFARDETQQPKEGAVLEVKDVDLIAKLVADVTYVVDDKLYHKLAFVDQARNIYYAEFAGHFDQVDEGVIVKLRSIIM